MMINNIVIYIFVSCFLFERIQESSTKDFTVDEFGGVWNGIGMITTSINDPDTYSCYQLHVTKLNECYNCFIEDVRVKIKGIQRMVRGIGTIEESKINVTFPSVGEEGVYSVGIFNEGKEIILRSEDRTHQICGMFSRSLVVLQTTKHEFEKICPKTNKTLIYFDHDNC